MIRLMYIQNMEKFTEALGKCQGNVLLHLPDNTTCDLKSNPAAAQVLKLLPTGYNDLRLSFSDSHDSSVFMRYMMVAANA